MMCGNKNVLPETHFLRMLLWRVHNKLCSQAVEKQCICIATWAVDKIQVSKE